jgi:hypothetical protein
MRAESSTIHPNPVNPYNAASEKTAATRRSYPVRKKLAKRAASGQSWAGMDQAAMIGQWMSGGKSRTQPKEQRRVSAAGKKSNLG